MLRDIKGAIFDMDGTLIDSMWVWNKIDVDFLKERNIELPPDLMETIEYMDFDDIAKYFKKRFNLKDSTDEIENRWNEMAYYEYAHNVPLKPYVKEYLSMLKSHGIKIGLATSNSILLLETVLKKHNIYKFFDTITTTIEAGKDKNSPDVYLLCAKKMNIAPCNCIVFEDILPAVISAKSGGMMVAGVAEPYSTPHWTQIKEISDLSIKSYHELLIDNKNYCANSNI